MLSTKLPVISPQKTRAVSLQRGRTKTTWNIQEYVSSQYQRKGIQGSHIGGCPERHRVHEQRGSRTHITMTAVRNNREMRGQEEETAKLRAE